MLRSEEYEQDASKMQEDLSKLAKNDRQKAMIGRLVLSTDSQLRNSILANQSRENVEVYKSKATSYIESSRATAIDNDDPMSIVDSVEKQQAVVSQLSDFMGEPAETKALKMAIVKEQTYVDWISQKAVNDPAAAIAMLEDEEIQKIIRDQNTLRTLKNFADRQMSIVRRAEKETIIKNEIDTGLKVATGEINNVSDVAKLAGQISPERAQAYIDFISNKDNIDFGDSEALAIYMDALFELGDKESIGKLTNDVFSGGSNGRVNKEQVLTYLKVANIRSQNLTLSEYQQYKEAEKMATRRRATKEDKKAFEKVKKPMTDLDVLYRTVSDWGNKHAKTPQEKEQLLKDFTEWSGKLGNMKNSSEEMNVDIAKKDIISKAKNRAYPQYLQYVVGETYKKNIGWVKCVSKDEETGKPGFIRVEK
jgi:hypothetical protein